MNLLDDTGLQSWPRLIFRAVWPILVIALGGAITIAALIHFGVTI